MPEDTLRYDKMVEDALRGVVRDALIITARDGLMGEHHFYITFRTRFPGVRLADYMLARHPDEMTIVLQHQYWGLDIEPDYFEVTLSFSGVSERLHIPFAAVTGFADPSAKFGLQFQVEEDEVEAEAEEGTPAASPVFLSKSRVDAPKGDAPKGDGSKGDGEGGKVVTLDAFRKK